MPSLGPLTWRPLPFQECTVCGWLGARRWVRPRRRGRAGGGGCRMRSCSPSLPTPVRRNTSSSCRASSIPPAASLRGELASQGLGPTQNVPPEAPRVNRQTAKLRPREEKRHSQDLLMGQKRPHPQPASLEHSVCIGRCVQPFAFIIVFIPITTLRRRHCYHFHIVDEKLKRG